MKLEIGGAPLLVASLDDIIKSKRAARRPRDLAVLETLEAARGAQEGKPQGQVRRSRAKLNEPTGNSSSCGSAGPPERRTTFLRNRIAPGRTAL